MKEFNVSATRAIKRLYAGPKREKEVYHEKDSGSSESGSDSGNEGTEDLEESTGPNETVFLVYLYAFFASRMERELTSAFYSRWRNLEGRFSSYWIRSKR